MTATVTNFDLMIGLTTARAGNRLLPRNLGQFVVLPHLSFGVIAENIAADRTTFHYRVSSAVGNGLVGLGLGTGWSSRGSGIFDPSSYFVLGGFLRPIPHISLGLFGAVTWSGADWEVVLDLAIRPFGNGWLTLFGDYALRDGQGIIGGDLSFGALSEPLDGLLLSARLSVRQPAISFGLRLSLGHAGASTGLYFADQALHSSHTVRFGRREPSVLADLMERAASYRVVDLTGPISYRDANRFQESLTLLGILSDLEAIRKDSLTRGVVVNTSGLVANRAILWEIRQKLAELRSSGKRVIVFIDHAGMDTYHMASAGDRIILDRLGSIEIRGYVSGATFFKGTLEKLGIGFEEWQLYEYKTAADTLSRDALSEADRRQRRVLIDDFYETARRDVCAARGFSHAQFDTLVNERSLFDPQSALDEGLVDGLGRWGTIEELVEELEGAKIRLAPKPKRGEKPEDDIWGEPPKIAVVYAEGYCALDWGIGARKLVEIFEALEKDPFVAAIVLRVDSPGGDPIAADLIAEAVKAAEKPVVVSQGSVAASGGYALSMHGDQILAAPSTVTGSIGVIGGWVYNSGFKEKLGISTDFVATSDSADARFGLTLPLVGLTLPDRRLTPEEKEQTDGLIRYLYRDFVDQIAEGRDMSHDEVDGLAQGRIWSGRRALDNGLIDKLGSLLDAIYVAREKAGIPTYKKVEILELPEPPLFSLSMFIDQGALNGALADTVAGSLYGIFGGAHTRKQPLLDYLRLRLTHNGQPLTVLKAADLGLVEDRR